MEEPSFHLARAFVSVVEHRSFAKAAQDLKMTPSSVSRLVKALEQQLGIKLINRTTRAMSLTDAGQSFFSDCGIAFEQLGNAYRRVRDQQDQLRGTLKLSAPVSFGRSHVIPYISGFMEAFPHLQLDLLMTDRYVDVVAEGISLAIRIGQLDDSSLIAKKLMSNRRILVAAPCYLQKHGPMRTVDDLKQHECLVLTVNRDGELWRLNGPQGECSVRPQGRVRADNGDAIRRFAIDGLGVAFLSEVTVAESIRSGVLTQILPDWGGRDTGVYGVCPPGPIAPAAKAVIAFLTHSWVEEEIGF